MLNYKEAQSNLFLGA